MSSLNGYYAIREKLYGIKTLTVQQLAVNEKRQKSVLYYIKLVIVLYNYIYIYIYIEQAMAPYQASDFTGFCDSYAVPVGGSDVILAV